MKRLLAVILWSILLVGSVRASGITAYDFLRNDVGARAAALGGSYLTAGDDPNILFYNPAGLATLSSPKVSFGFFKQLLDINTGHVSYGTTINGLGTVGAGIVYTNYGSFKGSGTSGEDLGTFSAGDLAATIGYAGSLKEGLLYGVSAKFIYSSIAGYASTAAALDFGMQYVAVPERIVLGASLANVGTQIDPYLTIREDLPLDLRVGVMLTPEHLPAAVFFDLHHLNESQSSFMDRLKAFSLGVEFTSSSNLHLRIGYNNAERTDLKIGSGSGLAGLSIGGGLTANNYTIDYAFNSLGKIGSLHRVTLGVSL